MDIVGVTVSHPRVDNNDSAGGAPPSMIAERFEVEAVLGRGGMGEVLRVREIASGKVLALKRLLLHADLDSAMRRELELWFKREFHTMARLAHPRIVQVYDFGFHAGAPWYTMELLDGQDLRALGQLDWRRAAEILREVASALAFLHQRALLHRDPTPRNIRLTSDGRAKLIDFGVLSTFGMVGAVAGTPPYVPPESLRGVPLDHRADLFALGALAYLLLTGRHAFGVQGLEDLEQAWRTRPPAPHTLVADIPTAMSELVLSLLALDPMARPTSAGEVIDRLGAIASLPPMHERETARGYLASAEMVGRRSELKAIKKLLRRTVEGEGKRALIEAPSGLGKSRLLREARLEAQLMGVTIASARAGDISTQGPYGVLRQLARELLVAAGESRSVVLSHIGDDAPWIARVLPELRKELGSVRLAVPMSDASEERLRINGALVRWLTGLGQEQSVLLAVDDLQRCDEGSAAVLGAFARQRSPSVALIAGLRTDEEPRAAAAIASIRDVAQRLSLEGLGAADVESLVRTTFGDAPNLGRLAAWLCDVADGSPLHCSELLRDLVDREVIKYADGIWSIPDSFDGLGVPHRLAEAMDSRVQNLSPAARALGEALGVHGGELTLPLCAALAEPGASEDELFGSLDELCFQQVLVRDGESYRFRHDGLREALLRSPDKERTSALHLRIGRLLIGQAESSADREAEVGWHLMKGGDVERGALLLERAGLRLHETQNYADAVPCLEAALEVLEPEGKPTHRTLPIRRALLVIAPFSHRELTYRYLDDTLAMIRRSSGIELAERVRFLGPYLALLVGVCWAGLRRLFRPAKERGPGPIESTIEFFTMSVFGAAAFSAGFDVPPTLAVLEKVSFFEAFRRVTPRVAWLLCQSLVDLSYGRNAVAFDRMREILGILGRRFQPFPIEEIDRKTACATAYYTLGFLGAQEHRKDCPKYVQALRDVDLRFFDVSANVVLSTYHRFRGEETIAKEIDAELELAFVQLGRTWMLETQHAWSRALAHAMVHDVIGLRRSVEQLEALHERGSIPRFLIDLTRGEYYRERGEHERAERSLRAALDGMDPSELQYRPIGYAALAETLLVGGKVEEGLEMAQRGLTLTENPATLRAVVAIRLRRVIALLHAHEGALDKAADELDSLLVDAQERAWPVVIGLVHEARARVAMLSGDDEAAISHSRECESHWRSTNNPVLIARAESLLEVLADTDSREPTEHTTHDAVTIATTIQGRLHEISSRLRGCAGPAERAERALEVLLDQTGASSGYLFVRKNHRRLEQLAPAGRHAPTEAVALAEQLFRADLDTETIRDRPFSAVVMKATGSESSEIVGVAVLDAGSVELMPLDEAVAAVISDTLAQAEDV